MIIIIDRKYRHEWFHRAVSVLGRLPSKRQTDSLAKWCGLTGRLWDTITVEDGNPLGSYRDHKDRNGGVCRYFYMRSGRRLRPAARTSEC